MMLRAYTIYDRKALQYHPPFFASTDGAATRSFADAVADPNSTLSRHPGDYVLFFAGTYDDQKGQLTPQNPLLHVIDALALVQPQQATLPLDLRPSDIPEAERVARSNGKTVETH